MVVDTSAILAIVFNEIDARTIASKLAHDPDRYVSAATLLETTIVLRRRTKSQDDSDLQHFLVAVPLNVVPFDETQLGFAQQAFFRFGQASGHLAQLNFGDCFSYALAKHLSQPLLYKGNDFSHTDLVAA